MKGAVAIVFFLAVSVPSCDGQQECDFARITTCTNTMTQNVFSNLNNNTLVCRFYAEYRQCVYSIQGCDAFAQSSIDQLTSQLKGSGVDIEARCGTGSGTPTPTPTTWPPTQRPTTMFLTTRPPWGCNVNDINMCSSNLRMEYNNRGLGCQAAENFMMCMNKLTSCMENYEFTRARQEYEQMGLKQQCPHVGGHPVSDSASSSTVSAIASLPLALMTLFWI